jgi:2-polyprenyl-6-methoxyphenol hydroxylase-like FAD-dependent oxidoreductase
MRTTTDPSQREHAVVIGASMGGLAAAAALAPHYRRVTVLDRDELPTEPRHRRAVPQSKHAHGLQPGGVRALEALLPGLLADLAADGAQRGDTSEQCRWTIGGTTFARSRLGADGLGVQRPVLEYRVRARVAALPGMAIRDHVEATGLLSAGQGAVTGVVVEPVGGGAPERIPADLVVDACGKVSKLPQWLAELGFAAPAEETVECRMAYLSRRWKLAGAAADGDLVTICAPAAEPHFGVMIAQEDGTHIVTLGGLLDERPASTDDAYLAFARSLPDPAIADRLAGATPVTDLQASHFPASRRRRYDKLAAFPTGLLALGDSVAAFNPMYGQGMSVAAIEAVALRDMLERGSIDARAFFRRAHAIEDVAWKLSTSGDLRYPGVVGKRTPDMTVMNRYLDRITARAGNDPVLAGTVLLVAGFIRPPQSFFAPSILWRALRPRRAAAPVARPVTPARPSPVAG